MSTRALRRLQREQEQQELLRQVDAARKAQEEEHAGEEVEEGEEQEEAEVGGVDESTSQAKNAFDMLEDAQDDDSEPEVVEQHSESEDVSKSMPPEHTPSKPVKSKKKRKKAKKRPKEPLSEPKLQKEDSGDEIDRALLAISGKHGGKQREDGAASVPSWEASATKLLAVDGRNLSATNEMRGLFGSVALEGEQSRPNPRNQNQRRREQNLQGGVDLATGLTGRYNVASRGKELGALAHRRNVFMQGKEAWPLASSGGLSMESLPDPSSFERNYSIMHSSAYQETQMQFRAVVESMDPQRMIGLLSLAPYHIATLLQVSEICKHQGDHSVSADLLERALFAFGRSVHSSFPMALREGTARLPFNKSANRELYLNIWRYIRNLEMRGTWKTAFEWAKLLLQLNTLSDPYGVTLMIDQLALRGRSHEQLLKLASDDAYGNAWRHLPNIQITLVLAHLRSKQPREARRQLALAIHQYPYIISGLASALDISPLPKTLWAKLPSTDAEKLYTELYVQRAKDLWNTPENSALLVEVAESMPYYESITLAAPPAPKLEISLEEARHILLLEIPSLIALLPRRFTSMRTSSSDPLPPPSSETESDLTLRHPQGTDVLGTTALQTIFNAAGAAAGSTNSVFQRILNWFHTPAGPDDGENAGRNEGEEAFRELQTELGRDVPPEMIEQLLRMHMQEADQHEEHHEPITAEGLGMAGDWDYYVDADENNSEIDVDSNGDSMPSLEDISTRETRPTAAPTPPPHDRNPLAATVEEDEDEDQPSVTDTRQRNPVTNAVLRHIDSDDEDEVDSDGIAPHPQRPTHTLLTDPLLAPGADVRRAGSQQQEPDIEADPQRLQRWLLTAGLTEVQADGSKMALYLRRMRLLRKQQQDWILNMIIQRGGNAKDVAESVRRHLGS